MKEKLICSKLNCNRPANTASKMQFCKNHYSKYAAQRQKEREDLRNDINPIASLSRQLLTRKMEAMSTEISKTRKHAQG